MYIAMNRFKIVIGREKDFERIWKERETHLDDVSGFLEFHLVKWGTEETHTLYASHSTWKSQTDFVNWTKSEAFRQAHKRAGEHSDIYLGHPVFEGFEAIPLWNKPVKSIQYNLFRYLQIRLDSARNRGIG